MFKEWLKQFCAVILCAITLLYCFPTKVFASSAGSDYKKNSSSDSYTYYIVSDKSVDKLFDFSLATIIGGEAVNWLFNFRSFTVIKEFTNDDGDTDYKIYFNTPNLQSIVKNQVISVITDGYTENTYDVTETEWMVDVGPDANTENAITKYGFKIPNYTYMGEYPKEVMSVAHILPTNFWEGLWRAILSIFGVSFLKAPDASNFNTITYLNHEYNDSSDLILSLFQNYFIKYFVNQINTANFSSAQDLIAQSVTEEENKAAEDYTNAHKTEYNKLKSKYDVWLKITDERSIDHDDDEDTPDIIIDKVVLTGHQMLGKIVKRNRLEISKSLVDYTVDSVGTITSINGTSLLDWFTSTENNRQGKYANLIKKWKTENSTAPNDHNADEVIYFLACAYQDESYLSSYTDEDIVKLWYYASALDTSSTATDRITVYAWYDEDEDEYSKNSISLKDLIKKYYSEKESDKVLDKDYPDDKDKYWLDSIYSPSSSILKYDNQQIDMADFLYFVDKYSLFGGFDGFELSDFLTEDELLLYETYNKKQAVQDNYDSFVANFGKNEKVIDKNNSTIGYSQCLIASEDEKKCESKAEDGRDPTTISVASLYAYSGLYRITDKIRAEGRDTMTPSEAIQVIAKIQTYCGPFYNEVLTNIITIMATVAANKNDKSILKVMMTDDPRVMPFDIDQLPLNDKANYEVSDPRVRLYKSHIIGGLVSNFVLNFGFGIYIKPQQLIINLGGKITEISVLLQQLCDFDILDNLGMSPTNMWQSAFITLLMMMLALFFILKTIVAIIKMGTKSGANLVLGFIVLVIELGVITAFAINPQGMWDNIKKAENSLIYLGEKTSVAMNSPDTKYLFADAGDEEVLYYMPYLDLWSKYNTGYGLNDDEQLMDFDRDKADLKGFKDDSVRIGLSNVKHYSVLLADAFSYYGNSSSVSNSIVIGDKVYNGPTINNNAYRVVDHFLAPRVKVIELGGNKLDLEVSENENFNNQFQKGFIGLICKFLNCGLMCLLSIIKFFTFLWQWFLFYILIFKIILGKGAEGKNWGVILLETFAPTLAMIFIGLYASIILQLGMIADGLIGILLELFLFWLTFMVIRWWKGLKYGLFFPKTLGWLYLLTNMNQHRRNRNSERLRQDAEDNAKDAGIILTDEEQKFLDKRTERLFETNGNFKYDANDPRFKKVYQDWYKFAINTRNLGKELTQEEKVAMRQFETDDRYKDFADAVNKYGTGKKLDKYLQEKIGNRAGASRALGADKQLGKTNNQSEQTIINEAGSSNTLGTQTQTQAQDQQVSRSESEDKWSRISRD